MGFVSDETLVKTVAKQISVEHINLKDTYIDSEVARLIPKEVAKKYTAIPVYKKDGVLYVAMSDPRNMIALDDLRVITQLPVRAMIASSRDIENAIELYYSMQMSERAIEDLKRDWTGDEKLRMTTFRNSERSVVRLANSIITSCNHAASDIHLEPFEPGWLSASA